MHVNAKAVSLCGLMLALTEVCIALGSVIESNTLFLLAAASYIVGIVIREMGIRLGAAFYAAGVFLGILITPNKFYVFSYGAMGLYILLREGLWERVGKMSDKWNRKLIFRSLKFLVFNLIYLTLLFAGRTLLFAQNLTWQILLALIVAGQIGFVIYDMAYEYVQIRIWTKMRGRLYE